ELTASFGDYLFVHAGVRPGVPIEKQNPRDLLWIRDEFLYSEEDFGKVVVHGHTPKDAPELRANRIGIDTGAFFNNTLTALRLQDGSRRFLTAQGGIMSRPNSFSDVCRKWPTITALAADMRVEYDTARKWKERDNIPSWMWFDLLRAAKKRKIALDANDLVVMARN